MSMSSLPDKRAIPLKLTFRTAEASVTLELVEFRKIRGGGEEVEISTIGKPALGLTLVLPTKATVSARATVSTHMPGNSIRSVAKVCGALGLLQKGCELEVFALKPDARLCVLQVKPLPFSFSATFYTFIDDLNTIAKRFNSDFILPERSSFSADDEETFRILRAFALSEPMDLTNLTCRLIKSPENAELVPQQLREETMFRMEHESATASLFGTQMSLGPTVIQVDRAKVERLPETLKVFVKAEIGSAVPISLRPLVPVRFLLVDRASLLSSREP